MLTDLEIAQASKMKKIKEIASSLGLSEDEIELYGNYKAKINLDVLKKDNKGKVILVTAISPTKAGEGKSTTTIGLADGFRRLGLNACCAIREPSFGPVMGVKGGAAGGGYAQAIPMEDLNLHFTGDLHAITTANNAISALIDNHIYQGNELNINPQNIVWKRCLDMNDRSLRKVIIGLDGNGTIREDGFDITVASEIMAILCLSADFDDLKLRLNRIVIAYNYEKKPITLKDLGVAGSIALILKDAIRPNLIQTIEHTPVFVHGGPFANIAHGCNSIIATNMARKLTDYVITEAGFGADLGCEKFFDIKSRIAQIKPASTVIVATIRALKMHGGVTDDLQVENIQALRKGICNLEKHCENVAKFNVPFVIAINKFSSDTNEEINFLLEWAKEKNYIISLSETWEKGGLGAIDLAQKVAGIIQEESKFKPLYELELSLEEKIKKICLEIYGASKVVFGAGIKTKLKNYETFGWGNLPICMAKTPHSFSDNPKLIGRPTNFEITIREVKPSIGAGFIVCITGDIMTMPGLPKKPAALNMDVTAAGIIKGLF